jgi:hypothetical protein
VLNTVRKPFLLLRSESLAKCDLLIVQIRGKCSKSATVGTEPNDEGPILVSCYGLVLVGVAGRIENIVHASHIMSLCPNLFFNSSENSTTNFQDQVLGRLRFFS